MKRGTLTIFLLIIMVVVGFRSGMDIDKQAFVISIGIDMEEDGLYSVTVQLPSAQSGANSNGRGNASQQSAGPSGYEMVRCTGHTVIDVLEMLSATIPHMMNYSQVVQVIVSENVANSPSFKTVLDHLLTARSLRQSAALVITRSRADEFIKLQEPFLGIRLSANIRASLEVFRSLGIIPDSQFGEVARMLDGGYNDVLLPYATREVFSEAAEPTEDHPLDVLPGEMLYKGQDKVQYIGAAVLEGGRMAGTLTATEMQYIYFLFNDMKQFTLCVDGVYYRMDPATPTRLAVEQDGDQWTLKVSGTVRACVLYGGTEDVERVKEIFANEVLSVIQKLQRMGADPVGFEGRAMRNRATLGDWTHQGWLYAYQTADIEARIGVLLGEVH